jgi:hypothetical protein
MASRIEQIPVTIPALTAVATPQNTPLTFNPGIVQRLEIIVPPGFSGLVGFRILHSGTVVIPYLASSWIITDNEKIDWPLENYPTGSAWSITGYNTDVYDHTLYLRFLVVETERYAVASVTPLAIIQTAPSAVGE